MLMPGSSDESYLLGGQLFCSDIDPVQVDPESRRVRAGGGATWRSVDALSATHRLAMPGGTYDTTGAAGLTLGGGIGHLMGLHGLSLDNLVSAEVTLADEQMHGAALRVPPDATALRREARPYSQAIDHPPSLSSYHRQYVTGTNWFVAQRY